MNTANARKAAEFTIVMSRDKEGRPRTLLVPGHGNYHHVILWWHIDGVSAECRVELPHDNYVPCPSRRVCYHMLAAVIVAFREKGYRVYLAEDKDNLKRLKNTGGLLLRIAARRTGYTAWMLAKGEGIQSYRPQYDPERDIKELFG